jgi:acetolactate synthase I/II/III large subunit
MGDIIIMKLSDYVFNFFESKSIDTVFSVSGGAAAHLLDSLGKSKFTHICNAHEQACAMAAEGYARINNKPALVLVTNGPGSTNTITGVLGAYQDSIPMIIISGQVPNSQSMTSYTDTVKLRQFGVQECDIIEIVKSITKFAIKLNNENNIKDVLTQAYENCMSGRKGPVWIDIPIDLQNKIINPDKLQFCVYDKIHSILDFTLINEAIKKSKRPLIITGNGIHLSNTETQFLKFVNKLQIPAVSSWTSKDLFDYNDPLFVGTYGIIGERAGNFAVQNADLLIILGSRMSIPNIGYKPNLFAPNAKKIMVDIDDNEIRKPSLNIDIPIHANLIDFFNQFSIDNVPNWKNWNNKVLEWKYKYSVFKEQHKHENNKINSFRFVEILSSYLKNEIIVTDMGTSYTCTMQALRTNGQNRLYTSSACCSMGFGLPGAIGTAIKTKNNVICICGDGGFQMNIQELQTVVHYKLPIKIFVLNNNGYLAISLMQDNLFNSHYVGCNNSSGVSSPDFTKIAAAYGIESIKINNELDLQSKLPYILNFNGPILCEIAMIENQLLIPRVQSKKDKDNTILSNSIENMFPYLSDEEMEKIMIK